MDPYEIMTESEQETRYPLRSGCAEHGSCSCNNTPNLASCTLRIRNNKAIGKNIISNGSTPLSTLSNNNYCSTATEKSDTEEQLTNKDIRIHWPKDDAIFNSTPIQHSDPSTWRVTSYSTCDSQSLVINNGILKSCKPKMWKKKENEMEKNRIQKHLNQNNLAARIRGSDVSSTGLKTTTSTTTNYVSRSIISEGVSSGSEFFSPVGMNYGASAKSKQNNVATDTHSVHSQNSHVSNQSSAHFARSSKANFRGYRTENSFNQSENSYRDVGGGDGKAIVDDDEDDFLHRKVNYRSRYTSDLGTEIYENMSIHQKVWRVCRNFFNQVAWYIYTFVAQNLVFEKWILNRRTTSYDDSPYYSKYTGYAAYDSNENQGISSKLKHFFFKVSKKGSQNTDQSETRRRNTFVETNNSENNSRQAYTYNSQNNQNHLTDDCGSNASFWSGRRSSFCWGFLKICGVLLLLAFIGYLGFMWLASDIHWKTSVRCFRSCLSQTPSDSLSDCSTCINDSE